MVLGCLWTEWGCLEVILGCGVGDLPLPGMLAARDGRHGFIGNGGVADSGVVAAARICFLV